MKKAFILFLALLIPATLCPAAGTIEARLKDIVRVDGLGGVELVGYGVVVGLGGTGDKDIELSKRTMANLLENFQISIPTKDIKSKNVATVMVTAYAPPFHKPGDHIDAHVSSIGDAISIEGGVLLMTPLLDPEGNLYALAQGGLTVGGFSAGVAGPGGQTASKNYTTVGIVPNGANLKKGRQENFVENGIMRLVLRHPDFTTANRIAGAINEKFEGSAIARDAGSVVVRVPEEILDMGQTASFLANLEVLKVTPDVQARVVVNERTGTIVMGEDVHIGEAVVAHGNLTVSISSTLSAYMPEPLTTGSPVITDQTSTQAKEDNAKVMLLPGTSTVRELADMLNQMGSTPRDLISILEALQRLGALQMEVVSL